MIFLGQSIPMDILVTFDDVGGNSGGEIQLNALEE